MQSWFCSFSFMAQLSYWLASLLDVLVYCLRISSRDRQQLKTQSENCARFSVEQCFCSWRCSTQCSSWFTLRKDFMNLTHPRWVTQTTLNNKRRAETGMEIIEAKLAKYLDSTNYVSGVLNVCPATYNVLEVKEWLVKDKSQFVQRLVLKFRHLLLV